MKVIIVYYSFSGITKFVAKTMASLINADELELLPENPYSFNYNKAVKEAQTQIYSGYCPKLINEMPNIENYNCVFIGSPNWLGTFAPPVLTFLKNTNLSNKTVVPFCTHGGGGFANIENNIKKECPNSNFMPIISLLSDSSIEDIKKSLKKSNFI